MNAKILFFICLSVFTLCNVKAQKPNILIAISDDQSFAHTSFAGCKAVKTPAFDLVAQTGIYFENGFAASPGCSPSRAALLTGRNTWQIEAAGTHASFFPKKYLSFPDILADAGYHTGYTGKGWGPGNFQISGRTHNPAGPAYNEHKIEVEEGISNKDYTANFKAFLAEKDSDQPFCFWYGAHEPHRVFKKGIGEDNEIALDQIEVPHFLPDVLEVKADLADYLYEIQHFDTHLMNMIELLKEGGEWENTIVIVTSDNGMAFPRAKANNYEYGVHVPLAMSWPSKIPGERIVKDVVGFTDIAPTLLEAVGIDHPGDYPMSGKSIMNMLTSTESGTLDPTKQAVFSARERHSSSRYHSLSYPQRSMRTAQYLYIRNAKPERWPAGAPQKYGDGGYPSVEAKDSQSLGSPYNGFHDIDACPTLDLLIANAEDPQYQFYLQAAVDKRPAEELYDIQADPDCRKNLAETEKATDVLAKMREDLTLYLTETDDPRLTDNEDIWETYPRFSKLRAFPQPEWAKEQSGGFLPNWVEAYWNHERIQREVSDGNKTSNEPPNVIVIITDDQGYGDFGFQGNSIIQTQHIDALAGRSAVVDRYYVSPVCAPTRACLMTGRYNYRTRVVDTYVGRAMMDTEETTIAELLSEAGYGTGIFGKWHLGDTYPMRPIDQGFDVSVVHNGGGLAQPADPKENENRYTNPILYRNGQAFQADGYCTDVYFEEAMKFIDDQVGQSKPFFTYIATNAPHGPYHDVPEALKKKYSAMDLESIMIDKGKDPDQLRDRTASICAMIENIDENIGKLMTHLEAANIIDNTVIFFMVDNGPNSRRYVGPLRGMKSEVHEGGIRSPLLVHWPGTIESQKIDHQVVAHIDVLPTILDMTSTEKPSKLQLDGISIWPLLTGNQPLYRNTSTPSNKPVDRYVFIQTHRGDVPQTKLHFAVIGPRWKLVHPTGFSNRNEHPEEIAYELYDLDNDPGESSNLAETYPDTLNKLLSAYENWFEDVSSTRTNNFAPPAIVIGHPTEPITTLTAQDRRRTHGNGWGWKGYWHIENPEAQSYNVEVDIHSPFNGGDVNLKINQETYQTTLSPDDQTTTFSNISIPKGIIKLEVELEGDDNKYIDYQVHVSK